MDPAELTEGLTGTRLLFLCSPSVVLSSIHHIVSKLRESARLALSDLLHDVTGTESNRLPVNLSSHDASWTGLSARLPHC